MKQNKTQKTNESVRLFLSSVAEEQKREDSYTLLNLMGEITQAEPHLWGTSTIGFGEYHYKYKTGREGDWFVCGFSPRKNALSIYLMCDLSQLSLEGLGKHKKGKGCLYIKKLEDIDFQVLERIVKTSIERLK